MDNQNFIIRILNNPKQIKLILTVVVVVAVAVLIAFGYQNYLSRQDQKVSVIVNELVLKKIDLEQKFSNNEVSEEEYRTQMGSMVEEFVGVYETHSRTQNAERALLTAALMDKRLENSVAAKEKLEKLLMNHSGSIHEPLVRYYLALLSEDESDYDGALNYLAPFEVEYLGHYLRPLAMFTQARIYKLQGKRDQAFEKYNEILSVEEFSFFFNQVQEQLDLLSLENKGQPGSQSIESFENNSAGDLAPDFNQTGSENSGNSSLSPDYQQN